MSSLVQLASDWRGALTDGGAMVETKIDGWRAMRFAGVSGTTRLWTRQGHTIEGAGHILHRLAMMEKIAGEPLMFDGEFQVGGTLAATKVWCESGWKMGGEAGIYHLFDCLPFADWRGGGCDTPLYRRKAYLAALVKAVEDDPALSWEWRPGSRGRDDGPSPVRLVADEWAFTSRDVIGAARRVWAEGGEGVMVKDAEAPYRRKRSDAWAKVKAENQHKWRMAA